MRKSQSNGELPLLHHLGGPNAVDASVIEGFGCDERAAMVAAIRWAFDHRRVPDMSQRTAADYCGIKSQHFSLILKGEKYLPLHDLNQFECVMGNTAVSQTLARFADLRRRELDEQVTRAVVERLGRAA